MEAIGCVAKAAFEEDLVNVRRDGEGTTVFRKTNLDGGNGRFSLVIVEGRRQGCRDRES